MVTGANAGGLSGALKGVLVGGQFNVGQRVGQAIAGSGESAGAAEAAKRQKLMDAALAELENQRKGRNKDEKERLGFYKSFKKHTGIQFGVANMLRQSQIFTSSVGAMFQLIGATLDILLTPLVPLLVPAFKYWVKWIVPAVLKVSSWIKGVVDWFTLLFQDPQKFLPGWLQVGLKTIFGVGFSLGGSLKSFDDASEEMLRQKTGGVPSNGNGGNGFVANTIENVEEMLDKKMVPEDFVEGVTLFNGMDWGPFINVLEKILMITEADKKAYTMGMVTASGSQLGKSLSLANQMSIKSSSPFTGTPNMDEYADLLMSSGYTPNTMSVKKGTLSQSEFNLANQTGTLETTLNNLTLALQNNTFALGSTSLSLDLSDFTNTNPGGA